MCLTASQTSCRHWRGDQITLHFTNRFIERFDEGDMRLIEKIYDQYFTKLIEGEVTVGHTSGRAMGLAVFELNKILVRKISPHTIAHEFMHLAQWNPKNAIPGGERACDVYTNALGTDVCDHSSYLKTYSAAPQVLHEICKEALQKRREGLRNYISWAEKQFENRQ